MATIFKKWIDILDFTYNTENKRHPLSWGQKAIGHVQISKDGIFATDGHKAFVVEDIFKQDNPYDLSRPVYLSRSEVISILKNIKKPDFFQLLEEEGNFYAIDGENKMRIANPKLDYPHYSLVIERARKPKHSIEVSALYLKQVAGLALKVLNGDSKRSSMVLNFDTEDITAPVRVDMVGAEHNVFAMLCPLNMQDQERPPKKRVFEIEKYKEDPDNPGRYLKTGRATYKELFLACREMLAGEGLLVEMDYFSASWKDDPDNRKGDDDPLPDDYKWLSCFAVTGGSEGWYIHVEMIMRDGRRELVCLGKILTGGISKAYQIAGELARFLQA